MMMILLFNVILVIGYGAIALLIPLMRVKNQVPILSKPTLLIVGNFPARSTFFPNCFSESVSRTPK